MNEKTVSLCIRCGKVTANLLKATMVKALAKMEQEKKQQGQKTNQKQSQKEKEDKTYKGKQSLDKLMKQNVQLSNIEITDGNIKSFERVAKKYSIDFSLKKDVTYEEVKAVYDKYYANEQFVRVLDKDVCPQTKWVEGSNYVDVNFKIDPRTKRIIMMGAMDNLVKGAAGQAVQNMNLLFGYKEQEGLELIPMFP